MPSLYPGPPHSWEFDHFDAGMLRADLLRRAICGSIVNNEHFPGRIGLLLDGLQRAETSCLRFQFRVMMETRALILVLIAVIGTRVQPAGQDRCCNESRSGCAVLPAFGSTSRM